MNMLDELIVRLRNEPHFRKAIFERITALVNPDNVGAILSKVPGEFQEEFRLWVFEYGEDGVFIGADPIATREQFRLLRDLVVQEQSSGKYKPPIVPINFEEQGVARLRFSFGTSEFHCAYCTPRSVGFFAEDGEYRGWIDLHFPCRGRTKSFVNVGLAEKEFDEVEIKELIRAIFGYLGLPPDQEFQAVFFKPLDPKIVVQT